MLVLSFSLHVNHVREYAVDYFWPMKGLLQGLDESVVLRCEEPTFSSNFTSTNLFKGNNHTWVNVFLEALLIIVKKKRKPPKCTVEEWLNKRF